VRVRSSRFILRGRLPPRLAPGSGRALRAARAEPSPFLPHGGTSPP
jgi:hypothetical protein